MRINKAKKTLKELLELRKNPQEQLLPSTQIKLTESIHQLEKIIILEQLQEKKDDKKQEIDEKLKKKKDVMMMKIDGQLEIISENGLKKIADKFDVQIEDANKKFVSQSGLNPKIEKQRERTIQSI